MFSIPQQGISCFWAVGCQKHDVYLGIMSRQALAKLLSDMKRFRFKE